jgi:glycosyltransferase involved in cell wall biosynthesis|tara:strand:+ start:2130 stop:3317 length:1188 start_codon:yes stop_codon:yes gene_type:complete
MKAITNQFDAHVPKVLFPLTEAVSLTQTVTTRRSDIRIAVVSDAIPGRNGVGTYYLDLLAQIHTRVGAARLFSPSVTPDRTLESFALPLPGDKTQRLAWPKKHELFKQLDALDPTVIVIPSLGMFSYFALRYALKKEISLVVVNHTDFDHLLSLYWPQWLSRPFRKILATINHWLCKKAVGVGVMNAKAEQKAWKDGASLVQIMATPLNTDFLTHPIQPIKGPINRAIFVGRLAPEKGIHELLNAVYSLPEMHFTIVGNGPLRKEVQDAAKSCQNLSYLGWIPRKRVREEIDAAHILLLPSAYETFGTVALEALARERFVVVSEGCGISKWPSLANGVFITSPKTSLTKVLSDIPQQSFEDRDRHARQSWRAVREFNEKAISDWLGFLDAATAKR